MPTTPGGPPSPLGRRPPRSPEKAAAGPAAGAHHPAAAVGAASQASRAPGAGAGAGGGAPRVEAAGEVVWRAAPPPPGHAAAGQQRGEGGERAGPSTSGRRPDLRYAVAAATGQREQMEDFFVARRFDLGGGGAGAAPGAGPRPGPSAAGLFGVFDGHSGTACAEFVARRVPEILGGSGLGTLGAAGDGRAATRALRAALLQADAEFRDAGGPEQAHSGSTALVALAVEGRLLVASVGDSRAVLSRKGAAAELTVDHKPDAPGELTRIESAGGHVVDGYLDGNISVSRALGNWHMAIKTDAGGPLTAEPDLVDRPLGPEDEFVLLACDGLFEVFTSQSAVDFARRQLRVHNDPTKCAEAVVQEALKRGTMDNVTLILVAFDVELPPLRNPRLARNDGMTRTLSGDALSTLQRSISESEEQMPGRGEVFTPM